MCMKFLLEKPITSINYNLIIIMIDMSKPKDIAQEVRNNPR